MIYPIYKTLGQTPLEALEQCRVENKISNDTPMTYAGRLDPMAEGLLLVLAGDDVYRKEEFLKLDKTYTVDVLWGFETDTYDLLGIPRSQEIRKTKSLPRRQAGKIRNKLQIQKSKIKNEIENFKGETTQKYPPYSSKTVEGKPLWQWAREGRLDEIDVPRREVAVYSIENQGRREITGQEILPEVNKRLQLVSGDFRQQEIGEKWSDLLSSSPESIFYLSRFVIHCSSGFYVRSFAHYLGKNLNTSACAFWIRRDRVGEFSV